jgi:hypothetical protein
MRWDHLGWCRYAEKSIDLAKPRVRYVTVFKLEPPVQFFNSTAVSLSKPHSTTKFFQRAGKLLLGSAIVENPVSEFTNIAQSDRGQQRAMNT